MNIAFYITNHGFGHIMRNIPVISHILNTTNHKVILVTGLQQGQLEFFKDVPTNILNDRLVIINQDLEPGITLKPGTLFVDKLLLQDKVSKYVDKFTELIEGAKNIFRTYEVDKVVCDIVPWALTAAKECKIPSVLMASFSWIEIYEEHLPELLIKPFREAFSNTDKVLLYELANEPTYKRFPDGIKVGLSARPFNNEAVQAIRDKYSGNPIVFLSIGGSNNGISGDIEVDDLPYTFITTKGLKVKGDNVVYLPVETNNTQDYIAASDYCISKAGWGTIAEILLARRPMALLERPDVAEDRMSIDTLLKRNEAISIKVEDLCDIGAVLKRMEKKKWDIRKYNNDYKNIAKHILCD